MPQAKGASMQLLLQRETTFRTAPAIPAAFKMPFIKYDMGRDPRKTQDPSISNSPLRAKSGCGDAIVQGTASSILDLRSIGQWLSLLFGVPTANKAVTKQPTLVTGVTVNYAANGTTVGNGTLTYTAAGTLLSWKAQADTAPGASVNVGAGGNFTLQSTAANMSVNVTVAASALPGANQTDTDITVSTTLKAHVFPVNLNDRPSALLELGHPDIPKFYRTLGAKLSKLSFDVTGEQNINLDLLAGEESAFGTVWDAAPTSYSPVRACGSGGSISNGFSTALGTVVGGDMSVATEMEGIPLADGKEGYGLINQGEVMMSGKVKTVFDSLGAYDLARSSTSTRMRIGSQATVGSDIFSLNWDMPNVELLEKSIPKEGKSGLFVEVEWNAHRDTAGNLPLITLINDVATY